MPDASTRCGSDAGNGKTGRRERLQQQQTLDQAIKWRGASADSASGEEAPAVARARAPESLWRQRRRQRRQLDASGASKLRQRGYRQANIPEPVHCVCVCERRWRACSVRPVLLHCTVLCRRFMMRRRCWRRRQDRRAISGAAAAAAALAVAVPATDAASRRSAGIVICCD